MTVALWMHKLIPLLFLILIPLPFIALSKSKSQAPLNGLGFWRGVIMAANLILVVTLITGIVIYPHFDMGRTWVAIILTLALGALLGIMSKKLKQYKGENDIHIQSQYLKKLAYIGFGYIVVLAATFLLMTNWWALSF
ncbi:hypothetical protein QA612_10975 [Evansella sp. AB-P1]|uniref:hypothetical protein n=1 Tax=Evansella sp. AB-P1 TaxID=3037653 RepID=UPI00241D3293|nr:hypothetical protein [Evansella sp. AB-P1]MDG5788012.1 hypothetical protein [Evansella sp. AB-P1]